MYFVIVKAVKTVFPLFVSVAHSVFIYTEGPGGQQKHSWFPRF